MDQESFCLLRFGSNAQARINEELSAILTYRQFQGKISDTAARLAYIHILATADHKNLERHPDTDIILDADLKILGASPDKFDEFDNNIAIEYSFYPPEVYLPGRIAVLRSFAYKPRIFITDKAHELFEDQARTNLERKIIELEIRASS